MAKSLNDANYREIYKIYEDGKHRRYTLLFAVNGAAAAITGIIPEGVDFREIAYLLVAVTITLCFDIAVFDQRIRLVAEDKPLEPTKGIFSLYGKIAFGIVCALLVIGWLSAARVINLL